MVPVPVSTGEVKIKSDVEIPVDGRNVLIVEDIIDSGNTLHFLQDVFKERNAKMRSSEHPVR